MNYNYKCVPQNISNAELGTYLTYGISLAGEILISDVSTDKEKALDIVSALNRLQVSPTHLRDVITDILSA